MKLTPEGCRSRQQRLGKILNEKGLDGAIIASRPYVYYFTGYLHLPFHAAAVLVKANGTTVIAANADDKEQAPELAVDDFLPYPTHRLYTMHNRQIEEAADALKPAVPAGKYGADLERGMGVVASWGGVQALDLNPDLLGLRKAKDPDEVEAIKDSIRITDVMYETARQVVKPGADEIDVFAEIQAAATRASGECLEILGNDYRANEPGGTPRRRKMNAGELYILDAGPRLHGYCADNCRTIAVDGSPSDAQVKAWERVDSVFPLLEEKVKPGISPAELFAFADEYFKWEGYEGMWHHLGHAIGLSPHETPELNPKYDAVFEVGNVFTMEPGLYSDELKAGIRLEENYLLTESGLEQLTSHPRHL